MEATVRPGTTGRPSAPAPPPPGASPEGRQGGSPASPAPGHTAGAPSARSGRSWGPAGRWPCSVSGGGRHGEGSRARAVTRHFPLHPHFEAGWEAVSRAARLRAFRDSLGNIFFLGSFGGPAWGRGQCGVLLGWGVGRLRGLESGRQWGSRLLSCVPTLAGVASCDYSLDMRPSRRLMARAQAARAQGWAGSDARL